MDLLEANPSKMASRNGKKKEKSPSPGGIRTHHLSLLMTQMFFELKFANALLDLLSIEIKLHLSLVNE